MPSSAVYEFLSDQSVNENHEDLKAITHLNKNHGYHNNNHPISSILPQNVDEIIHDIHLLSAYAYVLKEEPPYTNYTNNFKGVLDYIWCSSDHIRPLAVVPVVREDAIEQFGTALPNAQVYLIFNLF